MLFGRFEIRERVDARASTRVRANGRSHLLPCSEAAKPNAFLEEFWSDLTAQVGLC